MNRIKIVFFDIDGTLLNFGESQMTSNIQKSLRLLKRRGIKICIATGRPIINIPKFEGITFDAALAFNGSFSVAENEVITNCPIPKKDVYKIVENAKAIGRPVSIATIDKIIANGCDKNLEEYFTIAHKKVFVSEEFERYMKEDVYQIMIGCDMEERDFILQGTENAKLVAWWERAVDVIPKLGGKGIAIEHMLSHYEISKDEAIAFGDGMNDIDMFQAVGTGVAMGNASEEVKKIANDVCGDVRNDGVYHYLMKHKIIEE